MYFVSLLQGHHRTYEKKYKSWWCCTGTGMENPEKYENNIFFFDGSTLYINLYIPSRLETDGISLEINTDYPYSDKISIAVKRNTEIDSLKSFSYNKGNINSSGQSDSFTGNFALHPAILH